MNRSQSAIIIIIVLIVSVGTFYTFVWNKVDSVVNPRDPKKEILDGERKQYYQDGRIRSVINYNQGVKHGPSTLFHPDGKTVLLSIPYQYGKREGISKKYYRTGEIYAETSYKDDLLHGARKVYYRAGPVKSIVNYYQGHPGIGTEEFLTSGKKKPSIEIEQRRSGTTIEYTTSEGCVDARFYIGQLIEGKFFDSLSDDVEELPRTEGYHYLNTSIANKTEAAMVICSCKSTQGNPIVLSRPITW